ncbi:MAG: fenitrothion hydrolase [Solirubrobacterales bacterium]
MRRFGVGVAGVLVALAFPAAALAHGLTNRRDLPIPPWLFAWAAVFVLVASFVGLSAKWRKPILEHARRRLLFRIPAAVEVICGLLGVVVFAALIYAGFAGQQSATTNIVPTFVYVVFWVGVPLSCALFGNWFDRFSPWKAIARCLALLTRGVAPNGTAWRREYPSRMGYWPAAIGLFAFAWVELAYVDRSDPSTLATMMLAYAAFQIAAMSVFGIEDWSARGDAFGVYFDLFGRLSPLEWTRSEVKRRLPLAGLPKLTPAAGIVALMSVMIGTTSFDGFSSGSIWQQILPDLGKILGLDDPRSDGAYMWPATIAMLVAVALIAGLYYVGVLGMKALGGEFSTLQIARRFAHGLVPIAFAYIVAHYLTLLLFQGQAMFYLISDPLGDGSNLLGTAGIGIDYSVLGGNVQWYMQVAALVIGHVCALAVAHDRALVMYKEPRDAARSQYWMLVVMVAYTSLALWLLSDLAS